MSKIAISGASTGTATFTIESPATSTNRTLTLPDNTGTIITQNSTPAFASTIGVGGATAAASGAGITFPATQSASSDANTLDDYEEGAFQPSWESTGASFTYDSAYRHGRYTKIGNRVYFSIYISTSSAPTGTTSNTVIITGLPFAAATVSNGSVCAFSIGQLWNVDWPANKIMPTAFGGRNQTQINLYWEQDSAISAPWLASALLAGAYVIITGFYETA
jgi:hypothetical protein